MTSKENNKQTVEFLEEKNYFGYPKEAVEIFVQEEIPYLSKENKLIIDENMLIKEAANGNGGIFQSMDKKGILENIRKKEIEWIFIGSIDNILLELADTFLLGSSIKHNTKIGTKTVLKSAPDEKVGVFCKRNGKIKVIEYIEIPEKLAHKQEENGELTFGEAHIMCNLFHITALEKASTKELNYHIIDKGDFYKFEKFIFDAFRTI
jgi:UDP-N-acetylglucosamine/UDP-N-acetylgalactosamine diphosphorylase